MFQSSAESIERFMEDQAFSTSYDLAPPPPPPLLSASCLSFSYCVSPFELNDGIRHGGGGVGGGGGA